MCKLLNQQNAPELDIYTFDGDPMEFHYFMAIFHEVVERKVDDKQGKLRHLIKFTKGEAKEMIKTCIHLSSEVGFKTAKRLLHERYGDPRRITAAYRNQIKTWPQIKPGDSDAWFQTCQEVGEIGGPERS